MEALSVFDMLKIGVGPSSSHTLGPWRAVQRWLGELAAEWAAAGGLAAVARIEIHLYGSLALTGKGHATDRAICLALLGFEPETVPVGEIGDLVEGLVRGRTLSLVAGEEISFDPERDIVFHTDETLPAHANGMICMARSATEVLRRTYYSVGGGFVVGAHELDGPATPSVTLPYPAQTPDELRNNCAGADLRVADVVFANERAWHGDEEIVEMLGSLWRVMLDSVFRGCHTTGLLPGELGVHRRAAGLATNLLGGDTAASPSEWIELIAGRRFSFAETLQWVSTFAMAVNEENASLGRVVTAPTNGAAGVIPAVLVYHICFSEQEICESDIFDFLMVAGEIGTLFKKGATISAAMGGCQAEVGVSSAMAAAALAEAQGGSVDQVLMAAEIAMEHHLGMTCDPVGGLVQVPCIERNTMGAVKAINAAELALASDPSDARVSLTDVIRTLSQTAADMSGWYKETSRAGLAVNVSVRVPEC